MHQLLATPVAVEDLRGWASKQVRGEALNRYVVVADSGQERAARLLWQSVRWQERTEGRTLVTTLPPRSPVHRMLRTPAWAPRTSLRIAARSPEPLPPARAVAVDV